MYTFSYRNLGSGSLQDNEWQTSKNYPTYNAVLDAVTEWDMVNRENGMAIDFRINGPASGLTCTLKTESEVFDTDAAAHCLQWVFPDRFCEVADWLGDHGARVMHTVTGPFIVFRHEEDRVLFKLTFG